MKYKYVTFLVSFFLVSHSVAVFAAQENVGLWTDVSQYDHIGDAEKFSYFIEGQLRLIDQPNYYDLAYVHGALGYNYKPTTSFWAGYEWNSKNPLADIPAQNLFFLEMFTQFYQNDLFVIRKRSRYDQIKAYQESEWEYRLRGKFYLHLIGLNIDRITPLIYDEVFIKFNDTNWDSTSTFQQNWFFVGADIEISDTTFLEIGYLQQYVFDKPENRVDNVLYVGINFNPLMVPVYEYVR